MTALVVATFDDEGPFLRARTRLLGAERRIMGEWTPYATESLGQGDGQRGILPAAIIAGVIGAGGLFALETWSAVAAYPFNEGGRPLFSWQAFIPAAVEFGALAAAIGGIATLFRRAGLTKLHHAAFDFDEVGEASQGSFTLLVRCDSGEDANNLLAMMAGAGAVHSRVIGA